VLSIAKALLKGGLFSVNQLSTNHSPAINTILVLKIFVIPLQQILRASAVSAALIAFASTANAEAKTSLAASAKDRIVVIVSVDGLASYYLNDPKANLPTLRGLAAEGAVATRMKASLPSMTWPNHTTLVTGVSPGRHGVIGNTYWDRQQEKSFKLVTDPIFNKDEIVKVPTLYDLAHEAGLKTAAFVWPASRGATMLDWTVPDIFPNDLFQKYSTPSLLKEFRAAGIPYEQQEKWCKTDKGRERDVMYTQMLIHTIKEHRPNLALLHLVELDHVEHATGPRSPEAYATAQFEDERVKEIRAALEKYFPQRATLIITSDHGFIAVRQKIQPNVKLRQAGLLKVDNGKISERRIFAFDQGGSSFIYVTDSAHRTELIKQVAKLLRGIEGIDQIILPGDYKKNGLALPQDDPRMPDVVLTARNGFAFSDNATGDVVVTPVSEKITGAHGHNPLLPDMFASFIAWGQGIRTGAVTKQINNLDVAPTAAALLGFQMKNVEGRVLKEMLKK
jgi:predicted AlkP superfamily pyrophosphatase or phosphodiesterase